MNELFDDFESMLLQKLINCRLGYKMIFVPPNSFNLEEKICFTLDDQTQFRSEHGK